jgi:23S rRNA (cytosine1962-C5)-methyltransferase
MATAPSSRSGLRTRPRRYQLNKGALAALGSGHPWIFRKHVSSAAEIFPDGQWLRLVDGENRVAGWGFYQEVGAIAIRVLRRGSEPPRGAYFEEMLRRALARRAELRRTTDGFRALHGENDGIPAVTADVYDGIAVVSSYARGADPVARRVASALRRELDLEGVVWKPASRRLLRRAGGATRIVSGSVPELVRFREDGREMVVAPFRGQKSGAFLDLRGVRRFLLAQELAGRRALDLFSYTGSLGAAAEAAGATEIWHVDASSAALALGAAHHRLDPSRHLWIEADAFAWVADLAPDETFDVIIADPPQMTSRTAQVPSAIRAYDQLYRRLGPRVRPGGLLVACCCTSRIEVDLFLTTVRRALSPSGDFRFVERLAPEPDHPVGFHEADYLKILVFRRKREEKT